MGFSPLQVPVTTTTIAACSVVFALQLIGAADVSLLSSSYQTAVEGQQWWRIVTAAYSHVGLLHFLVNMISTFQQGLAIERNIGSGVFLRDTFLFLVLSPLIALVITRGFMRQCHQLRLYHSSYLGYSAVLFAWWAIESVRNPTAVVNLLGFIPCPMLIISFAGLFLMRVVAPSASLTGHISGIFAGYIVAAGLFSWVTPYFLFCLLFWLVLGAVYSVKMTASVSLGCITISTTSPATRLIEKDIIQVRGNTSIV